MRGEISRGLHVIGVPSTKTPDYVVKCIADYLDQESQDRYHVLDIIDNIIALTNGKCYRVQDGETVMHPKFGLVTMQYGGFTPDPDPFDEVFVSIHGMEYEVHGSECELKEIIKSVMKGEDMIVQTGMFNKKTGVFELSDATGKPLEVKFESASPEMEDVTESVIITGSDSAALRAEAYLQHFIAKAKKADTSLHRPSETTGFGIVPTPTLPDAPGLNAEVCEFTPVERDNYENSDYETRQIFSGGDLYVHVNEHPVRNLESIQWDEDRSGIRGNMVLAQYDRDPILDEFAHRPDLESIYELPDLIVTITGVAKSGRASKCSLFGVRLHTQTRGFSSSDLGNAVKVEFTAQKVSPWRPLESLG